MCMNHEKTYQKSEHLMQIHHFKKIRQKIAKSMAHVDVQTLVGFKNLRFTKNGQCFAHDCN